MAAGSGTRAETNLNGKCKIIHDEEVEVIYFPSNYLLSLNHFGLATNCNCLVSGGLDLVNLVNCFVSISTSYTLNFRNQDGH